MRSVIPFALFVVVVAAGCPESTESVVDARKPTTSERQSETGDQQAATAHEQTGTREEPSREVATPGPTGPADKAAAAEPEAPVAPEPEQPDRSGGDEPVFDGKSPGEWLAMLKDPEGAKSAGPMFVGPEGPALVQLGRQSEAVVSALVGLLDDEDQGVRAKAAIVLAEIGPQAKAAVPALLETLKKHPDNFIAMSLARLRPDADTVVPTLVEMLRNENPEARMAAANLLTEFGPQAKAAVPALADMRNDKDERVRTQTALALWKIDRQAEPAVSALAEQLKKDDLQICLYAARTLREIGPPAEKAVPALIQVMRKRSEPKDESEKLRQQYFLDNVRPVAAETLGKIGPAAVPLLIEALGDEDQGVGGFAARALAASGPDAKAALPQLTKLLESENPSVRTEAASALWRIAKQKEPTVSVLIDVIKQGKYDSNVYAARALGSIGADAEAAIPVLIEVVKGMGTIEHGGGVQSFAADALGRIGLQPETVVPVLIEALKHPGDSDVRYAAALSLERFGPRARAAVPALVEALNDKSPVVRNHAAKALEKIDPERARQEPAVAKAIRDATDPEAYMKHSGHTYFNVTTASSYEPPAVSTLVSLMGATVAIVSDCPKQTSHPNEPRRVSGAHITSDGREIPWACESTDARTFPRISVNGVDYRFADGNTFLISSKGANVRVLQMQLADNKILDLGDLRRKNAEVERFFTQPASADGPTEAVRGGDERGTSEM
jgi:HEAT repeat protein